MDGGELAHVFAISCTPLAGLADKCGCHFLSLRLGLDLARRFLPEALPIRYGPWEPLPYRYSNDEAFIDSVLAEGRGCRVRS